jgi:predicted hotdog family 3-hydroxylacyl-ACP dehydratase
MMPVDDLQLEQLIRHRAPMIFLDRVTGVGSDWLSAEVKISSSSQFFSATKGGVPAWTGIEYMAQAIAALAGVRAQKAGDEIPLGLLLGCRHFSVDQPAFADGEKLNVRVAELAGSDEQFGSYDCEILGNNVSAAGRLTVYGGDVPK